MWASKLLADGGQETIITSSGLSIASLPGCLPLCSLDRMCIRLQVVQRSSMRSRDWSRRRPGNKASLSTVLTVQGSPCCFFTVPLDGHASTCLCSAIWLELPEFRHQKSTVWTPQCYQALSSSTW